MSAAMNADAAHDDLANRADGWCGDATSVVEFLRPLREQLDAPGVLEVCVNRPGELLVETVAGWQTVAGARDDAGALPVAGHRRRHLLRPADQPGTAAAVGHAAERRAHPVRHPAGGARAARCRSRCASRRT